MVIAAGIGATLEVLGPPASSPPPIQAPASVPQQAVITPPVVVKPAPAPAKVTVAGLRPGRDTPGPVADPDPALEEETPDGKLPRISPDGRRSMQVYAAGFDKSNLRPKVGLILAGVGLNVAESEQAIQALPGAVTLAFSPYAVVPDQLLSEARLAEHEYFISIPMEPQSFPLNDPGNQALLTRNAPEENEKRLAWALSRISGYVGATGALGLMRGERFASVPQEIDPVLEQLAHRGLLYVDARPGEKRLPSVWQRDVDVIIDDAPDAVSIDARLAVLDKIAAEKGSALGLAGVVRPVTIERIAAWANELPAKGLALAPVSALALPAASEQGQ